MKIVIIYTFLMASGITVTTEPFTPVHNGKPLRTIEACEDYAARSVRDMLKALDVSSVRPYEDVLARCENVDRRAGKR